jgi:hypothetical protein
MTLLPAAPLGVRGHPGNAYDVPPTCAHPECDKPAAHVHHCWPRSFLRRQPVEWVCFSDGTVVGNRLGFCVEHHEQLTGQIGGYKARLRWQDGTMWWEDRNRPQDLDEASDIYAVEGWIRIAATKHQPPVFGTTEEKVADELHPELAEGEVCPTCGHHKRKTPREEAKPGKLRPTKEWTILVPHDAEVGAALLDDWVDDFAIVFGMDHYTSRLKRYHVLSVLRGVTLAMRSDIIAEVAAAAGRRVGK